LYNQSAERRALIKALQGKVRFHKNLCAMSSTSLLPLQNSARHRKHPGADAVAPELQRTPCRPSEPAVPAGALQAAAPTVRLPPVWGGTLRFGYLCDARHRFPVSWFLPAQLQPVRHTLIRMFHFVHFQFMLASALIYME
jgi:hypothetical protein